jgi:hypothetical protein
MTIVSTAIDSVAGFRWYLIVSLIAAYIVKLYSDYHRLRAFKGPFLARWTDLWFAKAVFGINQCGVLAEVCSKYGIHGASHASLTGANIHGRTYCPSRAKYPGHKFA